MDSKKVVLGLGLLLVIAFLGCAEQAPTPTPTPTTPVATTPVVTTPPVTTPPVTTPPPATPTPTPVPTPKTTPPVSAEPIAICALFDPRVPAFKAAVEAIRAAADKINAEGGIMGRKVVVYHEDTQRKVDLAITAYRSAVIEKKCKIVFVEGVTEEVMALIEEGAKIYPSRPHIMFSSQAGMETTQKVINEYDKYKFYFRCLPPDPDLNYNVAKWFFDIAKNVIGAKRVALILEDAAWTKCAREGCYFETKLGPISAKPMRQWVQDEFGLQVVYVAHAAVMEKNFLPMFEQIAANKADFIFVLSSWYTDTVTATKQWASSSARNIPIAFFGGTAQWMAQWNLTGGANLGTIAMNYDYEGIAPISPTTIPVIKSLHARGISLDTSAHYYYSETFRIKEAMEKVGNPDDIDAVIKAIEELQFVNHSSIPVKWNYLGFKNANFHSYVGGPTLNAQVQCNGIPVYIMRPEVMQEHEWPEEIVKMMNPKAYKPPAELRKICGS
ncbi:MAG: ABC transporter substrate-binding protein [Archaeoglobaceae archaeon]|nr:ABC transporter substrate-binding protein [Archaeoglobaceae archaeon]MDW8127751.1 ABC transporter substrate-binding protein [Archaeoglobaceae archaeon]